MGGRRRAALVVGAAGEEEFGQTFAESAGRWASACREAGAKLTTIGLETNSATSDRERLQQALGGEAKEGAAELWLVLLGHGTFSGKEAKFNLRGADVSATELTEWLKPFRRPLAVLNTSSASAPFLAKLSGTNRVIITATRSGSEVNYARLGRFLSEAIADPEADLDKDGQTSLLEAFLSGSRRTAEFYSNEGRLATERRALEILSTDGIKKRPVVVETPAGDSIAIHPVGTVAMSWDHRAIDGAYASKFLRHIQSVIESRDWEAELAWYRGANLPFRREEEQREFFEQAEKALAEKQKRVQESQEAKVAIEKTLEQLKGDLAKATESFGTTERAAKDAEPLLQQLTQTQRDADDQRRPSQLIDEADRNKREHDKEA